MRNGSTYSIMSISSSSSLSSIRCALRFFAAFKRGLSCVQRTIERCPVETTHGTLSEPGGRILVTVSSSNSNHVFVLRSSLAGLQPDRQVSYARCLTNMRYIMSMERAGALVQEDRPKIVDIRRGSVRRLLRIRFDELGHVDRGRECNTMFDLSTVACG